MKTERGGPRRRKAAGGERKTVIRVRGASEHNLKSIDVDLPRDRLVVITGLSGSGKSSLAFDTIYAEGQRRYVESLSAYARQFLGQMDKPEVESIEGLSPAIAIEQRSASRNPRSTVGTVTEIYDHLRLLFARVGVPHCPDCGVPIENQTVQQMVDRIERFPAGERLRILAPVVRGKKGEHREIFRRLRGEGFARVMVDGAERELEEEIRLVKTKKHDISVVVDRIRVKPEVLGRLADSLATALAAGEGLVEVLRENGRTEVFSEKLACARCGFSFSEISPRLFSFNSPYGACPACGGLGTHREIDQALVVPDPDVSVAEGGVVPWGPTRGKWNQAILEALARSLGFSLDAPFRRLPKPARETLLRGRGEERVTVDWSRPSGTGRLKVPFEGVIPWLERRYRETGSEHVRRWIEGFMTAGSCRVCGGARLRPEALAIRIHGRRIDELTALSIRDLGDAIDGVPWTEREGTIARQVLKEIRERLRFLNDVGLSYLTLARSSGTLSGGEAQRIRLATQIGSGLTGVLYVLDEPSIGLHARDNKRLLETLFRLRDLGNTVLVVEHDRETIEAADWVVDLGPGAGIHGGEVIAEGTPAEVAANERSLTGAYLRGDRAVPIPARRRPGNGGTVEIVGARENNLKKIRVRFPLGKLICVTGVSGSGKSTLVTEILYKGLARKLYGARAVPGAHTRINGLRHIDKVVEIDQSPIGRTPRSNPATYTGAFTPIREVFSLLPESRMRGYAPGRFSFNVRGGRCEACRGDGTIKIEMHFLPDVYVKCDVCKGKRYNRETLEIRYKGYTIADVLDLTVDEAAELMENIPAVRRKLELLSQVGLGYIHLGQPAPTLSGGEAQRIKLSTELSKRATGRTVYILDEPTTGLHFEDVRLLLDVLGRLADAGNTVIVIEHNLDVVKTADEVIDLGPEGGDDGGRIIARGTPEEVARVEGSFTGRELRSLFEREGRRKAGVA
ncbi:MAG: excinuclease ABC subunit UvrA [Candidatus Eisenbacteria bacterium]|nr:excinuclease ABC subunit UvrA [Candidatus Eisenbacteria bacterium]